MDNIILALMVEINFNSMKQFRFQYHVNHKKKLIITGKNFRNKDRKEIADG